MDEISIAYFVLSKIPFVLLLGMMLVTAVRLHGELSARLAAVSDPVSRSGHGEAGRWVLVVAGYVLLCIFLAVGASREVLEALRAGQWVLAGVYALPSVALAGVATLLSFEARALVRLTSRRTDEK